jgi:hypothetical protein
MQIDSATLKSILLEFAQDWRERGRQYDTLPPSYLGAITILEKLLVWIHQIEKHSEVNAMERLKSALKMTIVSLDEIAQRESHSPIEEKIIETARIIEEQVKEAMAKGTPKEKLPAAALIEAGIGYSHFATRVSKMKNQKKTLSPDFSVKRVGDKFYLVKKIP